MRLAKELAACLQCNELIHFLELSEFQHENCFAGLMHFEFPQHLHVIKNWSDWTTLWWRPLDCRPVSVEIKRRDRRTDSAIAITVHSRADTWFQNAKGSFEVLL